MISYWKLCSFCTGILNERKDGWDETPEIELGEDMKTLFLRLPDKRLEKITTENFKVCVNYVELIESKRNEKAS